MDTKLASNGEVVILCTSDVHCGVDQGFGYAGLYQVKENLKKTAPPARKTQEQIIQSWAKRLVKLLPEEEGIDLDDAKAIAHAKLQYKEKQIAYLEARQQEQMKTSGRTSKKREQLIEKIKRSNPLRRIEDETHARRILAAHYRHTDTAYDFELEELHELEERGVIERGNARELARTRISGIKQDE